MESQQGTIRYHQETGVLYFPLPIAKRSSSEVETKLFGSYLEPLA